jgi:O-antigen/teichoic acid export membrane protein
VAPRAFVRDSLGVAASQYLARAILVLRGLAAAAALGPFGYGAWNALNLIFDYGGYAAAGAIQGLDLELPAAVAGGDSARARRLMAGAWWVAIAGASLYALGVALYLFGRQSAVEVWGGFGLPALMLVAVLLQLAFQYLSSALRAFGRFRAVSLGHAIQAFAGGGLGLVLVWRFGLWGLVLGWNAGSLLALLWMRSAASETPFVPANPRVGLTLARAGLPIFGYFAATLVLRSVDRIALLRYGGAEALGLYGLGLTAVGIVLYLPEAVAFVLFPRLSAAARGARDPERTRGEAVRVHRALTVALPLAVGIAMVWAEPVLGRLLPAYRAGVPALRVLAIGALMLSAATVPSYFMLAGTRRGRLVVLGVVAGLANAILVFSVAARDPRPIAIAVAAVAGHTLFTMALLLQVGREWFASVSERMRHLGGSLLPAIWAGGVALGACAIGSGEGWGTAVWRSAVVALAYLPVLLVLGRGIGLRSLARDWCAACFQVRSRAAGAAPFHLTPRRLSTRNRRFSKPSRQRLSFTSPTRVP